MTGGSYQVVRKIRMNVEIWDADRISDQERIFGRTKGEGAPLTGTAEFDTPNFAAKRADGAPVIDPTARAQAREDLAYWRAGALVLVPQPHADVLRETVTKLVGSPGRRVDGVWVWDLHEAPQGGR